MRIQSKYLEEKLTAADPTSKWISDFVHSDNPKFAGKSKKERIKMALGASYAAKGKGTQNEALTGSSLNTLTRGRIKMPSDSGEPSYTARKKATQAQQDIVDRNYIKKVTTAAKRGSSTNTGLTAEEFVIKHKSSGQILSTHESEDSAKDEHSALSNREEYIVTRSKTPAREFSVKEQRQLHRVNVTVTDPNHPATTMRNTKIQKIVALSADDKDHAVTKAQQYYKDRGYKVHDHLYMGLKEASAEELLAVAKKVSPTAKISTPETRQKDKEEYEKRTAKHAGKPNIPAAYLKPQSYPLGGYDPKSNRSYSEEVELDEMDKSQPSSSRGAEGLPVGTKADPAKTDKVKKDALKVLQKQYKKVKKEVEIEEGIGSAIGGAIGQYAGSKMGLEHPARAHGELLGRAIEYHVRKLGHKIKKKIMGEEQESLPASKAFQTAHDEERKRRGLPDPDYYLKLAAQKKKEIEDMKRNEEVEQIDETPKVDRGLSDDDKVAARTARDKGYTTGRAINMGNTSGGQFRGPGPSPYKDSNVAKSGERKGLITKDAIRRTKDRIKSRLNTEEYEELDELNKSTLQSYADKVIDKTRTMPQGAKKQKHLTGLTRSMEKMAKEEVELDEISQNTALNAYAKRAARAATTKDPKDREKADKAITRIGKRWEADAQRRAWNRADKLIYKEETELDEGKKKGLWDNIHAKRKRGERPARPGEKGYPKTLNIEGTELDEAGRMQGGGKDPCWKGYKMIGTKNKAGREVPNCVPVKEEKTFKSLREKLNGNDQSN